jgi:hypothetical protein
MKWDPEQVDWLPAGAQELLRFACTRMVHSYKPVLMGILLDQLPDLDFPLANVTERFVDFYRERERAGLPVERRPCYFVDAAVLDEERCAFTAHTILRLVFGQGRGCLCVDAHNVRLSADSAWQQLGGESVRPPVHRVLDRALDDFYKRVELMGEAVYGRPQTDLTADAHEVVFLLPDPDDGTDLLVVRPDN